MRNFYCLCLILVSLSLGTVAQNQYNICPLTFSESGNNLDFPFIGGLNKPQFSNVDLDNDGQLDLFVFDRVGQRKLTFLHSGLAGSVDYSHAPEYEDNFPVIKDWGVCLDFNCDGIRDLLACGGNDDIVAYEGYYSGGQIQYSLHTPVLLDGNGLAVFNQYKDISAFRDVNGDGDIDILNFDFTGDYVQYYENQSQENGNGCGLDAFLLTSWCWGEIEKPFADIIVDFDQCPANPPMLDDDAGAPVDKGPNSQSAVSRIHPGASLMALDNDGDGDLDLMITDQSYGRTNLLTNDGDVNFAHMSSQDSFFPSYDVTADVKFFPANYHVDIDGDGKRDWVSAANGKGNFSENYNCSWYYKNTGTDDNPTFSFQQSNFLVSETVDVGTNSKPVFFDYNEDGLLDIVVGNYKYNDNQNVNNWAQLALYENVGTASNPSFELISRDWQNISALQRFFIAPTFGDLDGDGDEDMMLGDDSGAVFYYENNGGNFTIDVTAVSIDVGASAVPQLFDYDEDGYLDLIVGEQNGNVNYYRNDAPASGIGFTLVANQLGQIDIDNSLGIEGHSAPFVANFGPDEELTVFVASEEGGIYKYNGEGIIYYNNFVLEDSDFLNYIDSGSTYTSIHGADITGDGHPEFIIGNERGGLQILEPFCPYPLSLSVGNVNQNGASLSWSSSGSASQYYVEYRELGAGSWLSSYTNSSNGNFTLSGLNDCADYEARVFSVCSGTIGDTPSKAVTFSTPDLSASWLAPSLSMCSLPSDLNVFVDGDPGGMWSGGSYVSSAGIFSPPAAGNYTLTYSVGSPSFCASESLSISVSAAPNASWNPIIFSNCSAPVDLNSLLLGTSGGTWSGTNVSGSTFDPTLVQTGTYSLTYTVGSGACQDVQMQNVLVEGCSNRIFAKVFLEGPLGTSFIMSTSLNEKGLIPLQQPYGNSPWNYAGSESLLTIPSKVVDWVLVEVRDASFNLVEQRAGLLESNGNIADIDGQSGVLFHNLSYAKEYHIVIRHRNHLDVMSSSTITLPMNAPYIFSTSSTQALGSGQQVNVQGQFAMPAGDFASNGVMTFDDYNVFESNSSGLFVYSSECADVDFDGHITVADYNLYKKNKSKFTISTLQYP